MQRIKIKPQRWNKGKKKKKSARRRNKKKRKNEDEGKKKRNLGKKNWTAIFNFNQG